MPEKGAGKEKLKLLIATRNPAKFKEFQEVLSHPRIQLLSLRDFPEIPEPREPFLSFEENAQHKAIFAFKHTGIISLGDDSGLEVKALQGAPGIYSARFAGKNADDEKNNQKLIRLMEKVPLKKRTARFVCVLALALNEEKVKLVKAQARGLILFKPRGNKGFGYDPIFYYPPLKKTFAELSPKEKLKVSHRGRALKKLLPILKKMMEQKARRKS